MRAIVFERYGVPDVLRLADVERPVPKEDEVLVKVHATTVNRTDCAYRGGEDFITRLGYSYVTTGSVFKALRRPTQRILGTELAGEVDEVARRSASSRSATTSSASTRASSAPTRSSSASGRTPRWRASRPG
jgi:NADPH:quinone reductase-like Zn-dependent oxidoreductase